MSQVKKGSALLAGIMAASIAGPAVAQSCMRPAEHTAFNLRTLQSQLMVAALACNGDAEYNNFVRRFQGDLAGAYREIQGYFRRTAGGSHQRALDGFITTLANSHSEDGIRQGSNFCANVTPLFRVAMSQTSAASLAELAVERNLVNPHTASTCPDQPTRPAVTPRGKTRPAATRTASAAR